MGGRGLDLRQTSCEGETNVFRCKAIGACLVVMSLFLSGCYTMQFRMAEPVIGKNLSGDSDPPSIQFSKRGSPHAEKAHFVWENPDIAWSNRVNLRPNSEYDVEMWLPENFEFRRMQVLQGKAETLYTAIENAEDELGKYSKDASLLLPDEARDALLKEIARIQSDIDQKQVIKVSKDSPADRAQVDREIEVLLSRRTEKETLLREDDAARDKNIGPTMTESLSNQIADWRVDLSAIKARTVALRLMVENVNEPYPRVIRGVTETFDITRTTEVGAVPFVVEDEYLDWLREDKVVTIVAFDAQEKPEDQDARRYRDALPVYWPQKNLCVIEFLEDTTGAARAAHGGTSASTSVERENYFNVSATTFQGDGGYLRTYLKSADGRQLWVFGPDLTAPSNLEVWTQDEQGLPVAKLYPPDGRIDPEQVFVRQIAGVEGGAFDPVAEAKKRGKLLAITRLGNVRASRDFAVINNIQRRERANSQALAGE